LQNLAEKLSIYSFVALLPLRLKSHYCRFDMALVSMFWLAAGLGLPPSLPARHANGTPNYAVVLFYASYILVLNWTLLQVLLQFPMTRLNVLLG
jgi:hypothetical protein